MRGVDSVAGSGLACAVVCVLSLLLRDSSLALGYVAALTSKMADTASSEVGKAIGSTTFSSVPPFAQVPRGTEGAVSLEGTAAGLAVTIAFATMAYAAGLVSLRGGAIVVASSVLANAFESVLGATIQGKAPWLTNSAMNVMQTGVAAALALAMRAI